MRIVALLLCVGLCACTGVVSGGDAAGSNTDAGEACAPANRNDEIRLALSRSRNWRTRSDRTRSGAAVRSRCTSPSSPGATMSSR